MHHVSPRFPTNPEMLTGNRDHFTNASTSAVSEPSDRPLTDKSRAIQVCRLRLNQRKVENLYNQCNGITTPDC